MSKRATSALGSPMAVAASFAMIFSWALGGVLYFGFGSTWQLVINTSTTIITFLMVFIVQLTQNHDTKAFHLKLDEVIHALADASDDVRGAENLQNAEIEALRNAQP